MATSIKFNDTKTEVKLFNFEHNNSKRPSYAITDGSKNLTKNFKSIDEIKSTLSTYKDDYKNEIGRSSQDGTIQFREAIFVFGEEEFEALGKNAAQIVFKKMEEYSQWMETNIGFAPLQMDLHLDEGIAYYDDGKNSYTLYPKTTKDYERNCKFNHDTNMLEFIDGTTIPKEFITIKRNIHGHIILDNINRTGEDIKFIKKNGETGTIKKMTTITRNLTPFHFSLMQQKMNDIFTELGFEKNKSKIKGEAVEKQEPTHKKSASGHSEFSNKKRAEDEHNDRIRQLQRTNNQKDIKIKMLELELIKKGNEYMKELDINANEDMEELKSSVMKMEGNYNQLVERYNRLLTKTKLKDAMIEDQKTEIETLKGKIDSFYKYEAKDHANTPKNNDDKPNYRRDR